ncbi:ABC transporter substrate-binding protein [Roseicitreum antarcticum]|uniref:Peptide/nickel transport system substrate-binding protein n=1 Tax=Roseicitreum antarcticum TaxID=564137 RepID=A0A1H3AT80_9RHOB|nr:ABC transporter substrate-binding protein [Roseicitreum antarcticum]SDX32897.1 peptide/nickel transport system substrate-binding protein [Roseicitreum antarcticum]
MRHLASMLAATLLAGLPAVAIAQDTLRLRMNGDINVLDPIATTNFTIRNASYLMYDTLFAMDAQYQVQPQMADSVTISDDGLVYVITLRDGLTFHDGAPVTAGDVVASLERWGGVDGLGRVLFSKMDSIAATDDATLTITMSEPWGLVLDALGKISSNVPVIMPARLAATPASEAVATPIGSGPYQLIQDEWVPGSIAVFEKFDDYVPRDEPVSMAAGGKVAHFDRVELTYIPDTATAIDALIVGEIDWIEEVPADMLAFFDGQDDAKPIAARQAGNSMQLVVNHLNAPFDDPLIRQALQHALEQTPFLQAAYGDATDRYLECAAVFFCDTPYASDANTDRVLNRDVDAARALLDEAGYDGTPVMLMHVGDIAVHDAYYSVLKPMLEEAGFKVEVQASDWATVATRRASKAPVAEGGWNLFFTGWGYVDQINPMTNVYVAGACEDGWFGWACSEELQQLREEFAAAATEDERVALAERMQVLTHDLVSYVPMGQAFPSQGIASNLTGFIDSPVPFFWNVRRAE